MKSDINILYSSVNKLLQDICDFLSEEVKHGKLSDKASNLATDLIQRSKVQLEEISKVIPESELPSYLSMNQSVQEYVQPDSAPNNNTDDLQLYSDVDENQKPPLEKERKIINDTSICPFLSVPAQYIKRDDKFSYIEKKEKLLFFDHYKKFFMIIVSNWLLLYNNEKDLKPTEYYNLKLYEAKEVENKECSFELVSLLKNKSLFFTIPTKLERNQWILSINRISLSYSNLNAGITPQPSSQINNKEDENIDDHDQELYEELPDSKEKPKINNDTPTIKPELPPRFISGQTLNSSKYIIQTDSLDDYDAVNVPEEDIYDVIVQTAVPKQPENKPPVQEYNNTGIALNQDIDNNSEIEDEDDDFYDLIKSNSKQVEEYNKAFAPNIKSDLLAKDKPKINFSFMSKMNK